MFQRKTAQDFAGGIVKGGADGWSGESVGRLGASTVRADFWIVNEHDFDFRSVRHFGDRISIPVARRNSALIEQRFFVERVADAHDGAAFDLPPQLKWIDDDAGIDCGRIFFDDDYTRAGSDYDLADASPVSSRAKHGGNAAAANGN